jgi:hypothetical protein
VWGSSATVLTRSKVGFEREWTCGMNSLNENTTSSAVNGLPSCHFTFCRSLKV